MGKRSESRQALSRKVGITSSVQVELVDLFMAARTSSIVAGKNVERDGG
jgi:hypothetical protein